MFYLAHHISTSGAACAPCSRKGSLEHILSSCPTALGEGCYRWQHDQVLQTVAEAISKAVANNHVYGQRNIASVRAGEQPQSTAQTSSWSAHLSARLGDASPLGEAAQVPDLHYDNFIEATSGAIICPFKAGTPYRADNSQGGLYGRGK